MIASARVSTPYPVRLEGQLDPDLSRWRWVVKWLLAIPHYLVIGLFTSGVVWSTTHVNAGGSEVLEIGGGLIGILVLVAAVALAFTGRYPQGIFDLVMGLNRWCYRVLAYAALMRDEYPTVPPRRRRLRTLGHAAISSYWAGPGWTRSHHTRPEVDILRSPVAARMPRGATRPRGTTNGAVKEEARRKGGVIRKRKSGHGRR